MKTSLAAGVLIGLIILLVLIDLLSIGSWSQEDKPEVMILYVVEDDNMKKLILQKDDKCYSAEYDESEWLHQVVPEEIYQKGAE